MHGLLEPWEQHSWSKNNSYELFKAKMFNDEIIQTFILRASPVVLHEIKEKTKEVAVLFSYEKYIEILENPSTIVLLCKKWDISLPCQSFHFFLVRWNLKHLLDEDTPLWYFEKYALQFLLAPSPSSQAHKIRTKREDFFRVLVEKRLCKEYTFIKYLSAKEIFENELFNHEDADKYLECFDTMEQNICKFGFPKNLERIDFYRENYPQYFEDLDDDIVCTRQDMLIGAMENVHGSEMLQYLNPTDEEFEDLKNFIVNEISNFHVDVIIYFAERFDWHTDDQNIYIYLLALGYDVVLDEEFELYEYNVESYSFLRVTNREAFDKLIGDYIPENLQNDANTCSYVNIEKAAFDLPY